VASFDPGALHLVEDDSAIPPLPVSRPVG